MASINTQAAWMQLSEPEQLSEWRSFLDELDAGAPGYHRCYPVLMSRWVRGDVPVDLGWAEETPVRLTAIVTDGAGFGDHLAQNEADWIFGTPPF